MIARTYGTAEIQSDAPSPLKSRLSLAGKVALAMIACAVIMAPDTRQASAIFQLEQWPAPLKGSAPLKDKIQQLTTRVAALADVAVEASVCYIHRPPLLMLHRQRSRDHYARE